MSAKRKRWNVNRRVPFNKLPRSATVRECVDEGIYAPARFGNRYTVIRRDGKEVLHLLSDYYSDAVLEAAQDEDIEPFGIRRFDVATLIYLDNLYVGSVNTSPNGNQRTVEAIQRNVNNYTAAGDSGPSLTLSTQPVIPQEIADKGVAKAKQGGNV